MEKFEVSKSDFIKIKNLFSCYVFNRVEKGRFYVKLSKMQVGIIGFNLREVKLNQ